MSLPGLLRSEIKCLQRYLECTLAFNLEFQGEVNPKDFEVLRRTREEILKALDLFNRKIEEEIQSIPLDLRTPELRELARRHVRRKEELLAEISRADEQIFQGIQLAQDKIQDQLDTDRKAKSVLGKFKSRWVPESGESLDRKL